MVYLFTITDESLKHFIFWFYKFKYFLSLSLKLNSINRFYDIFIASKFLKFFKNFFHSKTTKICQIITINIEIYPISCYWFVIIKIYNICPIISGIKTIKFGFILIISLYFIHFGNIFLFQNYSKDEVALKILLL